MMATTKMGETFARRAHEVMTDAEIETVRGLVERHGDADAAKMLGLSRLTTVKILARLGVYASNVELARAKLAKLAAC